MPVGIETSCTDGTTPPVRRARGNRAKDQRDTALLQHALDCDQDALGELIWLYHRLIYQWVDRTLFARRATHLLDNAVGEILVQVIQAFPRFRPNRNEPVYGFFPWLRTVLRTKTSTFLRDNLVKLDEVTLSVDNTDAEDEHEYQPSPLNRLSLAMYETEVPDFHVSYAPKYDTRKPYRTRKKAAALPL